MITGPNASGKTTILKTTLFNIILSQQVGFGFYSSATINPYKYIHCYLNIPDTSGRDSLFQAEARRCKEILDSVKNSKDRISVYLMKYTQELIHTKQLAVLMLTYCICLNIKTLNLCLPHIMFLSVIR